MSRNSQGYLLVNNDPILWTMLNAIKQQQAEIETLRHSLQQKGAELHKLAKQTRSMQNLQGQMKTMASRLVQLEVTSRSSLADMAEVTGSMR